MKQSLIVFFLSIFVFSFFSSHVSAEPYNQIMKKQKKLIQTTLLSEIQEKANQGNRDYIYIF